MLEIENSIVHELLMGVAAEYYAGNVFRINEGKEDKMTIDDIAGKGSDHVAYRMETSGQLLIWLRGELYDRAESGGGDDGDDGEQGPRRVNRVFLQLARVYESVRLALQQVDENVDPGMAWMLLELARQQVGHAGNAVGRVGSGSRLSREEAAAEEDSMARLAWFLQRDRSPWPGDAELIVDFEGAEGGVPDFRPDTALELLPLQFLSNAAMTHCAGEVVQDPKRAMMQMAFGEYVWTILEEATELLEFGADLAGEQGVEGLVETGFEVAYLASGAFPMAAQIFRGPAGLPDEVD